MTKVEKNRDTSKLKTARLMSKIDLRQSKRDAERDIELLNRCVEELETLPLDEEWNCDQVDAYMGYADNASSTVANLIKFFVWKRNDIKSFWIDGKGGRS